MLWICINFTDFFKCSEPRAVFMRSEGHRGQSVNNSQCAWKPGHGARGRDVHFTRAGFNVLPMCVTPECYVFCVRDQLRLTMLIYFLLIQYNSIRGWDDPKSKIQTLNIRHKIDSNRYIYRTQPDMKTMNSSEQQGVLMLSLPPTITFCRQYSQRGNYRLRLTSTNSRVNVPGARRSRGLLALTSCAAYSISWLESYSFSKGSFRRL